MKTYIDHNDAIVFENTWISKDPANRHYAQFLQELEKGEAELVPYVPPAPTWEQIRSQRDSLLTASDWTDLPNSPVKNKGAWLAYRQSLRDFPQIFKTPEEVVWPEKP